MSDFINQLITDFGENTIQTGEAITNRASSYWDPTPISAKAVIKPNTVQELSEILKRCNDEGQIVVTHGGVTGCSKAADTTPDHVVISTQRMNKIEEIDQIGGTITIQAGAILENVQNKVAEKGFYYPIDLGARGSCTVGGNAATNAGGINVIRYGMMRNHVLGLEAVLADGTIISSMNKVIKNNAGYDLKQLFIGTEGTLGIITRVIVKLESAPNNFQTALIGLNDFSQVTKFLLHMKKNTGSRLSAFEVMWGNYYHDVTTDGGHPPPMRRDYPYYVIAETSGTHPASDEVVFMAALESALENDIINDAVIAKSDQERNKIWTVREDFEPILNKEPMFLYDISLPIKYMETYTDKVQKDFKNAWPNSDCYAIGHIGDGNLHFFVCPNQGDETLHHQSNQIVYDPLKEIGGSVSAEHGIGHEKKEWLSHSRSDVEINMMKILKKTLDPNNILNPGVIF
ncbi:MAG: FAD-binding oxidoreductase [Kordiimonadaceae bacterium]|nr:FAD-binding oxidoreductase [Kordiimonadaceae bacterium]